MLKKIISGGQAGVELAALDAAIRLGFSYGGWAYNSKRTEDPDVTEQQNLTTIDVPSYHIRLEENIIDSDGTAILTHGQLIIGTKINKELTNKHNKSCLDVNLMDCSINHAVAEIRK